MQNDPSQPKGNDSVSKRKDVAQAFAVLATIGLTLCALSAVSLVRFFRAGDSRQELAAHLSIRELQTAFRKRRGAEERRLYVCLSGRLRAERPLTVDSEKERIQAILVREAIVEEVQLEHVAAVAGRERVLSQVTTVAESTRRAPCVLDDGAGQLPVQLRDDLPLSLPEGSETRIEPHPNEVIHYGVLEYKTPAKLTVWQGNVKRRIVAYSLNRRILPNNVRVRIYGTVRVGAAGPVLTPENEPSRPFKLVIVQRDRQPIEAGLPGSAEVFIGLLAGLAGLTCLGWSVWILRHPQRYTHADDL